MSILSSAPRRHACQARKRRKPQSASGTRADGVASPRPSPGRQGGKAHRLRLSNGKAPASPRFASASIQRRLSRRERDPVSSHPCPAPCPAELASPSPAAQAAKSRQRVPPWKKEQAHALRSLRWLRSSRGHVRNARRRCFPQAPGMLMARHGMAFSPPNASQDWIWIGFPMMREEWRASLVPRRRNRCAFAMRGGDGAGSGG